MRGVDRVAPSRKDEKDHQSPTKWAVEVKVYGYPMVISSHGEIAEFRKKRALELLTWLTLNRDRARRSAARTALWEFDVTDSSFSTVVSDMRRALREISKGHETEQWVPTTYSDELPLSSLVVTDADRLRIAHSNFLSSDGSEFDELMKVLKGVRDVPFAGTNYGWADLDGSTTRLVISAVNICTEVAEVAHNKQNDELLHSAVSAGLRVFPGCEELLDIQDRYLANSFTRRIK
jgi:two-component SAPR family response regulator